MEDPRWRPIDIHDVITTSYGVITSRYGPQRKHRWTKLAKKCLACNTPPPPTPPSFGPRRPKNGIKRVYCLLSLSFLYLFTDNCFRKCPCSPTNGLVAREKCLAQWTCETHHCPSPDGRSKFARAVPV